MMTNTDLGIIVEGKKFVVETASRVVAGANAKQFLSDVKFTAYVSAVGEIQMNKSYQEVDLDIIEQNPVRCPETRKGIGNGGIHKTNSKRRGYCRRGYKLCNSKCPCWIGRARFSTNCMQN